MSYLFRHCYLCSKFYSEIFPLLIFRVRLVERGSPHSLPLTESGKVVEAATYASVTCLSPFCPFLVLEAAVLLMNTDRLWLGLGWVDAESLRSSSLQTHTDPRLSP